MTPGSLYPGFIQIGYHSPFSRHLQTIPTRRWNPLGGTFGFGGYIAWNGLGRDAFSMIEQLVLDMKPFYRPTIVFDTFTIFDVPTVGASPNPVAAGAFTATTGSSSSTSWYEAVQTTFTLFDTGFKTFKLVMLDSDSNDQFIHVGAGEANAIMIALVADLTDDGNAWQSRQEAKPNSLRSVTFDLNDKLRRSYHLS